MDSGNGIATLTGHGRAITAAVFRPGGSLVVTCSGNRTARIWKLETGELVKTLRATGEIPIDACFAPDGTSLAVAFYQGTIRLYNAPSWSIARELTSHRSVVASVRFNPDGGLLVSASSDGTARIWRVEEGALLATIEGRPGSRMMLAEFSPDGRYVITVSEHAAVRVWPVDPLDEARSRQPFVALEPRRDGGRPPASLEWQSPCRLATLPPTPDAHDRRERLRRSLRILQEIRPRLRDDRCREEPGKEWCAGVAFSAMAHDRLGEIDAARGELAKLRPEWFPSDLAAIYREARALIAGE